MADTKTPLEVDGFYHLYNRAVGDEKLFFLDKNYDHFLFLAKKYLLDYFDFYGYCLMPNHFHFIFKVKSRDELPKLGAESKQLYHVLSRQLSNFFNSYAQAINKQQNRKGSLFANRYKRKHIDKDDYLLKLIHYIHYNPVEAGLSKNATDWKFSSYNAILSSNETVLKRDEVLNLFGGIKNYIYCHNVLPNISGIE